MRAMVFVPFLGGCGRDYCERLEDEVSSCDGAEPSLQDLEGCRQALEECNGDDQELLEDSLDCQIDAGLYACEDEADRAPTTGTPPTTTDDFSELFQCFIPLAGISPECAASVGVGFTATGTPDDF